MKLFHHSYLVKKIVISHSTAQEKDHAAETLCIVGLLGNKKTVTMKLPRFFSTHVSMGHIFCKSFHPFTRILLSLFVLGPLVFFMALILTRFSAVVTEQLLAVTIGWLGDVTTA